VMFLTADQRGGPPKGRGILLLRGAFRGTKIYPSTATSLNPIHWGLWGIGESFLKFKVGEENNKKRD
jgi:hypothetical protein